MSEVALASARPEPPRRDHAMFDAELSGQALNLEAAAAPAALDSPVSRALSRSARC